MDVSPRLSDIIVHKLTGPHLQTASAFWSVLIAPKFPIMKDVLAFINVSSLNSIPQEYPLTPVIV